MWERLESLAQAIDAIVVHEQRCRWHERPGESSPENEDQLVLTCVSYRAFAAPSLTLAQTEEPSEQKPSEPLEPSEPIEPCTME
jgi:hypothetical protein